MSLRGLVIIRWGHGTGAIASAWPKGRDKLSEKQQNSVDAFREAAWAVKQMDASQQAAAYELSQGTQLLPRDMLYMALYGRVAHYIFTDGRRMYSMASRSDITEFLDGLGYTPGSVMVRDATFWTPLPPGNPGEVLTVDEASGLPQWRPGGGTGAPRSTMFVRETDGATSNTWPKYCDYEGVLWDDAGIWDPDNPTRLVIPAGVTRARLTALWALTPQTQTIGFFFSQTVNGDTGPYPGVIRWAQPGTTAQFSNNEWTLQGGWVPVTPGDYFEVRANRNGPSYTAGWLSSCWAQLEYV